MRIEELIQKKAYELDYEKCGIIPVSLLDGYTEKLNERIQKVPESKEFYKGQQRLTNFLIEYPWAKSVVVLVMSYNKYKVPEIAKGRIGKTYLFETRVDINTKEYQNYLEMDNYLAELGLRTATNQKFGIVGLRWAALEAGLGIVRRNNFFYTESGSWVHIEAWLTDREMELKQETDMRSCPKGCNLCMRACPTKSLSEAYTMSPTKCISYLTTFGGRNLPEEPLRKEFGECIYGCDICQEVCPMNKGKWEEKEEFPGLEEIIPSLTPEKIVTMTEEYYQEKIQPKFFYLTKDELWKWKVNALCYMENNYRETWMPYITNALQDENETVRKMAAVVSQEISNKSL